MRLALVGGQVVDGKGGAPLPEATVVIDGSKIAEVSQHREFGSEVHIINVAGKTVMPGLIDCHTHFAASLQILISRQEQSLAYMSAQAAYSLKGCLEAGCTTARDMGGLAAGYRDAVEDGLIPGPRLQCALAIIQPTNGLLDNLPGIGGAVSPQGLYAIGPGLPTPWCDGPYEARKKVREVLRWGADLVKVANEGLPFSNKCRPDRPLFTQEELDAIVDEAHRAGVPVACHAYSQEAVLMAVRAGVDSIEEGCFLDEVCTEQMAKHATWYVPCLSNPRYFAEHLGHEESRTWHQRVVEGNRRAFTLAMRAGVPIAMGTDSVYAVGVTALELQWMVEAGMSPMQAIETSTRRGAECMGFQDQIGTLEAGKEADLLIVDGDPLRDISVISQLDRLALVVKGGRAYSGTLLAQFPPPPSELPRYWL